MLTILSPAKTLDFESTPVTSIYTIPEFVDKSEKLANKLRKLTPEKLSSLMNISSSLATLNFERYQMWHQPFTPDNAIQAVLAFNGEVYNGLKASTLPEEKLKQAQNKLRILSGLYGVLRPLDLIQPYRLEMGTKLGSGRSKNLYDFWRIDITKAIHRAIEESGSNILVNLASNEYYKSINTSRLKAEIITPVFKDRNNNKYKIITIYAKKARGLMARFILENDLQNPDDLPAFDSEGYHFNQKLSKPGYPVFTRG